MDGPTTLWTFLSDAFIARGATPAIISPNETLSYAAFTDRAAARAREIAKFAAPPGRWAVEEAGDPVHTLVELFAAWAAGLSPIILRRTLPETTKQLTQDLLKTAPQSSAEGLLCRTSGTTGSAKLAALPGAGVYQSMAAIADDFGWREGDRLLAAVSLSYGLGLTGGALAALYAGAEVHTVKPGAPMTEIVKRIRADNITLMQGPASMHRIIDRLATSPLENVRLVGQGGETCPPAVKDIMGRLYPNARLVQYFGMTEAGPRVAHIDMSALEWAEGGMGMPFPHLEWRGIPLDDTPLLQLWLKGPTVFLGYLSEAGYHGLDSDGGFSSGDLISLTPSGMPAYRGRLNRCFKSGGHWVNPYAIERALEHIEGVASVLCSAAPHALMGNVPVASIVSNAPGNPSNIDLAAIRLELEHSLESFELPVRIDVVADLPRNDSGKISRAS